MGFLDQALAARQQGQQYTPGMTTIPGQRVGETEQDASYEYEMPTWLYNAAGPNAIGQAQAAGSTAGFGGFGGAISNSINSIGGKNLYAARSPFQDMQGYTDNKNIYVRDPSSPGAWLSYDALSPAAKAALQGKYSALNGTNYNVLDANGNVIGQRAFTGLKDQDHVNDVMMAVAGAALGGMAAFGGAAGAGGAAAGGTGGAGSLAGSGAGFIGEGAASGIPAWDAALAASPSWSAAGGLVGGGMSGLADGGAPMTQFGALDTNLGQMSAAGFNQAPMTQFGVLDTNLGQLSAQRAGFLPGMSVNIPAGGGGGGGGGGGAGASPAGAASSPLQNIMNGSGSASDWMKLGSLGLGALAGSQPQTNSATTSKSMDPRMDSLFYGQLAPYTQGLLASQMPQAQTAGTQMLSVGSNLLGQTAPTTATNPYLKSIADDMQYRTKEMLDQNNLGIQGNAVATGSLGGSRQGVAQGLAAGKAADYLQGNVAGLYGNAYNQDQNRLLQQQTLGAGLLSQGLDTMYQPLKNTASVFSPFTGFGTSNTSTSQGGGAMGAVGGAVGAYGLARQLFGNNNGSTGTSGSWW